MKAAAAFLGGFVVLVYFSRTTFLPWMPMKEMKDGLVHPAHGVEGLETIKMDARINQLKRNVLDRIDVNLHQGTLRDKLIEPEKLSPSIRKFLQRSLKLRHNANQVLSEIEMNRSATTHKKQNFKSNSIIYNRIPKTGSGSLTCKPT